MRAFSRISKFAASVGAVSLWLAAAPALAVDVPLNVEFDTGATGTFATLSVTESGGDLNFAISLAGTELGPVADLNEFYFNLADSPTGVAIFDTNAPTTAYVLTADPSVAGGAGSSFDYGVNFGSGAGGPGNGVLQLATFSISADQALSIDSLRVLSSTSGGLDVNFALHVQGTNTDPGSETVGGVIPVPEPGTLLLLLGTGIVGLASRRRGAH